MANKYQKILFLTIIIAFILRFINLGNNPPSLYWDEASLGYNAYSILKTGRDEHGELFPVTRFIAFGDYKPPGYIYASVPFVVIFGVNEFAIRFASALAGVLSVLLTYFLVKELFAETKTILKKSLALASTTLLAISPWHIHFSRVAFEANLATLFSISGIYFFLRGIRKGNNLILSSLFFCFSMYTFNTHRIFVPLQIITLFFIYRKNVFKQIKWIAISSIIGLVLIIPLIPFVQSREGQLRFQEVTIFRDHDPILKANERISRENNTFLANFIHNRRMQYTYEFLRHYFDHFGLSYLFIQGDINPRLGTRDNGLLYLIELPLILFGFYYLIRKNHKTQAILLFSWLLLGLIPAATARETPHALRTLNILPVPQIIAGFGLVYGYRLIRKRKLFVTLCFTVYIISVINYLHTYYVHYPQQWAYSWQYGYKQMVQYVAKRQDSYDKIFITNKYGRPYIYFLLYQKYSPENYWRNRDAERDWFGFWTVNGFENYRFGDFPAVDTRGSEKWLLVAGPDGLPNEAKYLDEINFPNGQVIFEFGEIQ